MSPSSSACAVIRRVATVARGRLLPRCVPLGLDGSTARFQCCCVCGGGGGWLRSAVKAARVLGPGRTVVTLLCDGGDRWLYSREWLEHGCTPTHSNHCLDFITV